MLPPEPGVTTPLPEADVYFTTGDLEINVWFEIKRPVTLQPGKYGYNNKQCLGCHTNSACAVFDRLVRKFFRAFGITR